VKADLFLTLASGDIVAKQLDGEVIFVNMATGVYYSLDAVGSFIWWQAAAGKSIGKIRSDLKQRYANAESFDRDFDSFVGKLDGAKIAVLGELQVSPAPLDETPTLPPAYKSPELFVYDDVAEMIASDPPLPEVQQYKPARD
jgi:hypothetical protein